MSSNTSPLNQPSIKVPGYTGHVHGLSEMFARTPVLGQLETHQPGPASLLAARLASPITTGKDPCSEAVRMVSVKAEPANLWPHLQTTGAQEPAKPASSMLRLGDERIKSFATSYSSQFNAPFDSSKNIRSPLRNNSLKHMTNLKEVYNSAYGRVGEKRLRDILHHMRGRLNGKLGNHNNNAFKLRKMFKMYDPQGDGYVEIEDFRATTEAYGMQLDDDSLFAIYYEFDRQGTGRVPYHVVMKELVRRAAPSVLCSSKPTARFLLHLPVYTSVRFVFKYDIDFINVQPVVLVNVATGPCVADGQYILAAKSHDVALPALIVPRPQDRQVLKVAEHGRRIQQLTANVALLLQLDDDTYAMYVGAKDPLKAPMDLQS